MKSKINLLLTSVLLTAFLSACMIVPVRSGYYYHVPHWEPHSLHYGWR